MYSKPFNPIARENARAGLTAALGLMKKPSAGVLGFIALGGAISGATTLVAVHRSHAATQALASFCVGIAAVVFLYVYAPRRWHSIAGFPGRSVTVERAQNVTLLGCVAAIGATLAPLVVALLALKFGWRTDAIMSCLTAALSGFSFSLVALWCVLLQVTRVRNKQ